MKYHLALASLVGLSLPYSAAASPCDMVTEGVCRTDGSNTAIAENAAEADRYVEVMKNAQDAFRIHFEKDAQDAVVIGGVERANNQLETLRDQGFDIILPWLGSAEKLAAVSSALRQQLRAAQPDLPDAVLEVMVSQATTQPDFQLLFDPITEAGAIAHELCHQFLIETFAFKAPEDALVTGHYGGTAPDWLDETAAIVCENDKLTEGRYEALKAIRDGDEGAKLWPLSQYLTMSHPGADFAQQFAGEGVTINVTMGDELEEAMTGADGINAEYFYVQSRLFADYLHERSGRLTVLGSIAQDISAGRTFKQWLHKNGPTNNLPKTIRLLETDWDTWIAERLAQID